MNSLRLLIIPALLVGSAVGALLFGMGVHLSMPLPVKWILYFPFYGTVELSSVIFQMVGVRLLKQILFSLGVALSAVYLLVLLEKIPRNVVHLGAGMIFFVFLLICGRYIFVRFIYAPESTVGAAVYSIKVFVEFLVGLGVLYVVLNDRPAKPKEDLNVKR